MKSKIAKDHRLMWASGLLTVLASNGCNDASTPIRPNYPASMVEVDSTAHRWKLDAPTALSLDSKARRGDVESACRLGMYVPHFPSEADTIGLSNSDGAYWLSLAADSGHKEAEEFLPFVPEDQE